MLRIVKSPNFNYFELKNWAAENKCWRACDVNTRTLITVCHSYSYSCCRAVCSKASVSVFVVQSGRGVAALITLPLTKITQKKAKIETFLPKSANNFFRPEGQFKNGVLNYRCHFYETLASIDWHCAHCCLASVPRATVLAGVAHGRGGVRTAGGQ